MRLKSVFISEYKNLKDFSLSFEGASFIDIFVGKNGSGKSNFLESLISIFDHIYDFDRDNNDPDFEYSIVYSIDGKETSVEWTNATLRIDGRDRKTFGQTPKPENILVYYSGQNAHVTELIEGYEARFRRRIRGADLTESPAFIGIGQGYKKLLILMLLLLPEEQRSRQYLCEKLGILGVRGSFRLHLGRPIFAKRRSYDHLDPSDLFWGAKGIVRGFLEDLIRCVKDGATPGALHERDTDRYVIEVDVELFQRVFAGREPDEIFRFFNNLKILGMLDEISMQITLQGIEISDLGLFSDGQFQSVYLFAISELFKDRNCITLLDEPDAFLHPEWQYEFLKQTQSISEGAARTNHILLSSHSASTVAAPVERRIRLLELEGDKIEPRERDKSELIKSLSAGLITFSEKEARLNIAHNLKNTTGPVLFTEGVTDEIILETAWEKLYPNQERPFEIQHAFDCSYLRNLIRRGQLYADHPGRKFFALFDFDEAYSDWVQLGDQVELDPEKCLTRKHGQNECYAMLLPVSRALSIKHQIINPDTNQDYGPRSKLTIELLFHDVPGLEQHFEPDPTERDHCIRFAGDKLRFADQVVGGLAAKHFEALRPIFVSIQSRI